ncbi:hypothetical protein [Rhizobacter sp. SG703]|uniref:hypothetical protein n=1 Tax=Rhizobacter sp. SG703 TaxID=2587140 RepID=UPI0014476DE9|nr:hypothetical protein [Rhizobacter sp. SG703]
MINRASIHSAFVRKTQKAEQTLHTARQKIKHGMHKAQTLVQKVVSGTSQDPLDNEAFRRQLIDANRAAQPRSAPVIRFGKNQIQRTVTGHQMARRIEREKVQAARVSNTNTSASQANPFDAASDAACLIAQDSEFSERVSAMRKIHQDLQAGRHFDAIDAGTMDLIEGHLSDGSVASYAMSLSALASAT